MKVAVALFVLAGVSFISLLLQLLMGYSIKHYQIPLGLLFLICSLLIWHVLSLKTDGPRNLFPFQPPVEKSRHPFIYSVVPRLFILLHVFFGVLLLLYLAA